MRIFAGDGFRAIRSFRLLIHLPVEHGGQTFRFFTARTEHQASHVGSGFAVNLDLVDDVTHAIRVGELFEPTGKLGAILACHGISGNLLPHKLAVRRFLNVFANPVIVERAEHILFKRLLQANLIRDVIAK